MIEPISSSETPAMVAASAVSLRYFVRSWPGLMPAATAFDATPAASPSPHAVPRTDCRALSMIWAMPSVEVFSPASLPFASSMSRRRAMPFFAATVAMVAPMAVTPAPMMAVDFTAIVPTRFRNPSDILLPTEFPSALGLISCSMRFPAPLAWGMTLTYATADSVGMEQPLLVLSQHLPRVCRGEVGLAEAGGVRVRPGPWVRLRLPLALRGDLDQLVDGVEEVSGRDPLAGDGEVPAVLRDR